MTQRREEIRKLLEKCMSAAVQIAIVRHGLTAETADTDGDDADTPEEIGLDAAYACFGEGTCDENPIPEVSELMVFAESLSGGAAAPSGGDGARPHMLISNVLTSIESLRAVKSVIDSDGCWTAYRDEQMDAVFNSAHEFVSASGGESGPEPPALDPRINLLYNLAHGWMKSHDSATRNCALELREMLDVDIHSAGAAPPAASGGQPTHGTIIDELGALNPGNPISGTPATPSATRFELYEQAIASAVERERKDCAKAVCAACGSFSSVWNRATPTGGGGSWIHSGKNDPNLSFYCGANSIWSRASQPSNPEPQGGKEQDANRSENSTNQQPMESVATGAGSSSASGLLASTPRCPKCGNDDLTVNPPTDEYRDIEVWCSRCKWKCDVEVGARGFAKLADFSQFFPASSGRDVKEVTGEQLKAIAMRNCTIVSGYEFAEKFDFDVIAKELNGVAPRDVRERAGRIARAVRSFFADDTGEEIRLAAIIEEELTR